MRHNISVDDNIIQMGIHAEHKMPARRVDLPLISSFGQST